jgi:outer membrane receptor protein involved in Fe transport
MTFATGATADVIFWSVGPLNGQPLAGYTRTDVRLEWPLGRGLSVDVAGQNIFDRQHVEFSSLNARVLTTVVPRSVGVHLTWSVAMTFRCDGSRRLWGFAPRLDGRAL